jgi:hypothetical protein
MPDDCAFSAASVTAANLNLRFFGTTDVFDGWLTVYNVADGARKIRTPETLQDSMGEIGPEFGASKNIRAEENLSPGIPWGEQKSGVTLPR